MKKSMYQKLLCLACAFVVSVPMVVMNAQPKLASEYCETSMGGDVANGAAAGFTWETNASGDVVITLSEVDGGAAGTTNFRKTNGTGQGMCDTGLGKFKVGGADATDYFERDFTVGSQEYTLKLKDGVDAPAIGATITFSGIVEYETSVNKDAWPSLSFSYTYGAVCGATLSKPTNIAISSDKEITFDAVSGATSYKAFVFWGSELRLEQVVTSGALLNFHPSLTGTYEVYLQAYGSDDTFSPCSDAVDWILDAELAYLPQSEWCETLYETGGANESEDVNVTWRTDAVGNVIMTLSPVEGKTQTVATELRALMSIDNFKVGAEKEDASTYFTASYSGATQTFTLKDPSVKPTYGITLYYDGLVAYKTGIHNNCWPTLHFTHVYGSNCAGYNDHTNPVISDFSVVETDVHSVTFHIAATDVDDLGTSRAIAKYEITSDDNDFETIEVTPDGSGNFTVDELVSNGEYSFTIRVIDAIGNVSTSTVSDIKLPLDPDFNLAKGKTAVAGKTQGENVANRGCDGNDGTIWSSYTSHNQDKEYWYVDLGALYTIRQVNIKWMNDYSKHFLIQGVRTLPAEENREDDSYWTTYLDYTYDSDPETTLQEHEVVGKMRYLRLKSLQNEQDLGIEFYELEVYGSDYATEDNVAPVIGTKECTTDSENESATLTLTATDAVDGAIKDFYISCASPALAEAKYTTNNDNQITISDLDVSEDYTFAIRCRDLSGNWVETTVVAHFSMAEGTNVAEGKTATAGYVEGENTAAKAVDGNDNTRFGNYGLGVNPNWWKVDLANAYLLSSIAITWQTAPGGGCVIEGSLDDVSYTEITTYNGNEYNTKVRQALEITGEQAAIPYRYIRVRPNTQANFMSFYEFEVYATKELVMIDFGDEVTTNTAKLSGKNGVDAIVSMDRNISADDSWYTLCVPFDMSADKVSEVFGTSTIAKYYGSEDRGSLIRLNFDYVNAIEAGKPYMIKVGRSYTAGTYIVDVPIREGAPVAVDDDSELFDFKGTYEMITLDSDNQLFVGADNYLYSPAEGGTDMGAFRCYFEIPDSSPAPSRPARIVFGGQEVTDIEAVDAEGCKAQKMLKDGVLYIMRDGKLYNAQGLLIK